MDVRYGPRRVTADDLRAIDAILDELAGETTTEIPPAQLARLKEIVEKGLDAPRTAKS
jgi:hypothetical protein